MQRKGQWLYNKIRENYPNIVEPNDENAGVGHDLWNITNDQFNKIMEEYNA